MQSKYDPVDKLRSRKHRERTEIGIWRCCLNGLVSYWLDGPSGAWKYADFYLLVSWSDASGNSGGNRYKFDKWTKKRDADESFCRQTQQRRFQQRQCSCKTRCICSFMQSRGSRESVRCICTNVPSKWRSVKTMHNGRRTYTQRGRTIQYTQNLWGFWIPVKVFTVGYFVKFGR